MRLLHPVVQWDQITAPGVRGWAGARSSPSAGFLSGSRAALGFEGSVLKAVETEENRRAL